MTLKSLARQIKQLLSVTPEETISQTVPVNPRIANRDNKHPTPFQIAWSLLRKRRMDNGQVVSGETRRALRANLMKAIKEKGA